METSSPKKKRSSPPPSADAGKDEDLMEVSSSSSSSQAGDPQVPKAQERPAKRQRSRNAAASLPAKRRLPTAKQLEEQRQSEEAIAKAVVTIRLTLLGLSNREAKIALQMVNATILPPVPATATALPVNQESKKKARKPNKLSSSNLVTGGAKHQPNPSLQVAPAKGRVPVGPIFRPDSLSQEDRKVYSALPLRFKTTIAALKRAPENSEEFQKHASDLEALKNLRASLRAKCQSSVS